MRTKISLLIVVFFLIISCQEKFDMLPEKYNNNEALLTHIIPDSKVQYWEVEYVSGFSPDKMFSKGDEVIKNKIPAPVINNLDGFLSGCQPMLCSYRINYIQNSKWYFVENEDDLEKFIGRIDNEFEAFLIAKCKGYDIDSNSKGNGFQKTDFGYRIKVMLYDSCPESKKGFILNIDKSGNVKNVQDLGYYMKSKNCIFY